MAKHILAIAELNGWNTAITIAVAEGLITKEAAQFIAEASGQLTGEILAGKNLELHGLNEEQLAHEDAEFEEIMANFNAKKQGYPNA